MRSGKYFSILLCLFVGGAVAARAADPEQAVRQTVQRYYEACMAAQWKTAEKYVDRQSIEIFRANPPSRLLKYEIRKVEFRKEGQEAVVTVGVDSPVEQFGGRIMTLNAFTLWRLNKGKWYLVISPAPPLPVVMQAARLLPPPKKLVELQFDSPEADFGWKRQGDPVHLEFPFTNVSDHPVRVTASLVSICDCMSVTVSKETVAPGEKASVLFTIEDSTPFTFNFHQGIGIKAEPGGGILDLDIIGFFAPASENPPQ
ncbi:MAG: DUF1573 domain-containing protein [Acidobacteria bacterium]|nr:DUF1573 domain-containing protein [Acidobacteriota bacterium]